MNVDSTSYAAKLGFVAAIAVALVGCSAEDLTGSDEADLGDVEALDGEGITAEGEALALAEDAPTAEDVYIESITTGGGGCPNPGDVTTEISGDRKSFLMSFDKMNLDYPPPPKVKNLNCVAGIKLHVPQGFQVSLATVTTRGYAYLPHGGKARETSSYFFAGNPLSLNPHSELKGPYDDRYEFIDKVPFASLIWSRCGESSIFAVNTSINLNMIGAPNGTGYMNAETVDGGYEKLFHVRWKTCH